MSISYIGRQVNIISVIYCTTSGPLRLTKLILCVHLVFDWFYWRTSIFRKLSTLVILPYLPPAKRDTARQHSSRTRTACLPIVCVSVATTRCQYWFGGWSSSEQISTGLQWWSPDVSSRQRGLVPMSIVSGEDRYLSWVMVTWHPPSVDRMTDRQTPVKTLLSRNSV